jgi:hypothetical protein
VPFNSNETRWSKPVTLKDLEETKEELPGPGSYMLSKSSENIAYQIAAPFGKTDRRFKNE